MEHVAILSKSSAFLGKILSGEKTIESRWYSSRRPPWGRIHAGEKIYFKESGCLVSAKAEVSKVLEFSGLGNKKIIRIISKYGRQIGFKANDIPRLLKKYSAKKYCILVFLKNPASIPPFKINKAGYGNMSAWLLVESVGEIRA